jgi:hypothetical protein
MSVFFAVIPAALLVVQVVVLVLSERSRRNFNCGVERLIRLQLARCEQLKLLEAAWRAEIAGDERRAESIMDKLEELTEAVARDYPEVNG